MSITMFRKIEESNKVVQIRTSFSHQNTDLTQQSQPSQYINNQQKLINHAFALSDERSRPVLYQPECDIIESIKEIPTQFFETDQEQCGRDLLPSQILWTQSNEILKASEKLRKEINEKQIATQFFDEDADAFDNLVFPDENNWTGVFSTQLFDSKSLRVRNEEERNEELRSTKAKTMAEKELQNGKGSKSSKDGKNKQVGGYVKSFISTDQSSQSPVQIRPNSIFHYSPQLPFIQIMSTQK